MKLATLILLLCCSAVAQTTLTWSDTASNSVTAYIIHQWSATNERYQTSAVPAITFTPMPGTNWFTVRAIARSGIQSTPSQPFKY